MRDSAKSRRLKSSLRSPPCQVVLAVTMCTRAGKLVLSRQFVEMTRIRIEGLVAAFPKLLGAAGKAHTFVETDNVR